VASIFSNKFFSLAGQRERLKNVALTYRMIGSNLLRGRVFTSIPVSPKYKGTIVGGASKILTAPAGVVGIPAAAAALSTFGGGAAAAGIAGRLRTAGAGVVKVIGRAGNKVIKVGSSRTGWKALGVASVAGLGYAAYKGARSFGNSVGKYGLVPAVTGPATTTTTIPDPSNPDGPGITVETTGDADPPNITFMQDPEGNLVPYIAGQGDSPSSFYEDSFLGKAGVPSWTIPALVIGGLAVALYASRKKR